MSAGSAGPAGVKNLRAMFENKNGNNDQVSSPNRGRSPNGSVSSAESRQVSKVRANFVPVELPSEGGQPGQCGLRKTSDVSSMAEVKEEATRADVGNAATKSLTGEESTLAMDGLDLGAILKGSPFEGSPTEKTTVTEKPTTAPTTKKVEEIPSEQPKMNGNTSQVASTVESIPSPDQITTKPPPASGKAAGSSKPVPSSLNTKAAASKSKESPSTPKKSPLLPKKAQDKPAAMNGNGSTIKPRGGVNKIQGVINSANKAKEERAKAEQPKPEAVQKEKKTTPKEIKLPSVAAKPTAASKAHAQKSTAPTENVQVKSPTRTRSMKLPSAATATTAASAARKDATAESEEPKKATNERMSINPQAPRIANTATKASLAKKSSRASLANGEDKTRSRPSINHKPADESFLARMTRPTASSTQKAHGKVEVSSPPRQRQTSANHSEPKKAGRKSVNGQNAALPSGAEETEETILEPATDNTAPALPAASNDVGEPGSAEEELVPFRQTGVLETTRQ